MLGIEYADRAKEHIDKIFAIRIDNWWNISATYTANVSRIDGGCGGSAVTDAVMPLIAMIHTSDTLVFRMQQDCDAFRAITRRHVSRKLGKRCVIKSYFLTESKSLEDMIMELSLTGLRVSDWIQEGVSWGT